MRTLKAGRHEPYESRGSRADLWGPEGETSLRLPGRRCALNLAAGSIPPAAHDDRAGHECVRRRGGVR